MADFRYLHCGLTRKINKNIMKKLAHEKLGNILGGLGIMLGPIFMQPSHSFIHLCTKTSMHTTVKYPDIVYLCHRQCR